MRITPVRLALSATLLVALLLTPACSAADAPIAGQYSDGNLTVDLAPAADGFTGTITLGDKKLPATAHAHGHALDGSFTSAGTSFSFTATLDADTLTLSTGGKTYTLKRLTVAVNPLGNLAQASPALANPLAPSSATSGAGGASGAAPGGADAPPGYTVEVATDFGKSLIAQKPNTPSVQKALEATFPELAKTFGARPTIGTAYQDAKDPNTGGATFSANVDGHPVRGFVSCKLHDGGATVAVIYGRADATKAQWDQLMSPPVTGGDTGRKTGATPAAAGDSSAPAAVAPPNPGVPLHPYDFPDGTGTIGLPDGWTTKAQTCIHPVGIAGPAEQFIILGNSVLVQTPDSPTVQMMKRNQAMMKDMAARSAQMGIRPQPPAPVAPMLIAPFTDPVEALKNLVPQFSKVSEFRHGPTVMLDRIISSVDTPTVLKGGKGADILYVCTRTLEGKSTPFRVRVHLQVCPIGPTAWMWFATSIQAPDATFDRDLPVMSAIVASLKINQDRAMQLSNAENAQMRQMTQQMAQQSQQNLEASAKRFQADQDRRIAIGQAQHEAQMQGYAQHNQQWQAAELQKSRNAADFIETIKGTRTVYDTVTGTSTTADLNYVNGVVNSLNAAALDPNRFVQIPLRDEMYPVPPEK